MLVPLASVMFYLALPLQAWPYLIPVDLTLGCCLQGPCRLLCAVRYVPHILRMRIVCSCSGTTVVMLVIDEVVGTPVLVALLLGVLASITAMQTWAILFHICVRRE